MALTRGKSRIKRERQAIYFDLICGVTQSVISLTGAILTVILNGITNVGWFITGLTFWMFYLLFSLLMISYGIYSHFKEKNFDETNYKKDLRAPIV